MIDTPRHFSAFRGDITQLFDLSEGKVFYDLTLGDGGHSEEALEAGCKVVSVDVDPEAIKRAVLFVSKFKPTIINSETEISPVDFKWLIINTNFTDIGKYFHRLNLPQADAIMVDLGPSQFQVLSPGRGFSFSSDEPLDMRLSKDLGVTAADLLNVLNEGELANLLSLSDEPFAKPIARAIVKQRSVSPITTTLQLADLVSRVKKTRHGRTHPATQTFMSLRMAVNLEREAIRELLPQLLTILRPNGVLGIISFHSGEDKIIKDFIRQCEERNQLVAINKKPIEPSKDELTISMRTRSAKFRLARKTT